MRFFRNLVLATVLAASGLPGYAGNLLPPVEEQQVEAPPAERPQGSVNGGYLLIGAFVLMALAVSAGS